MHVHCMCMAWVMGTKTKWLQNSRLEHVWSRLYVLTWPSDFAILVNGCNKKKKGKNQPNQEFDI